MDEDKYPLPSKAKSRFGQAASADLSDEEGEEKDEM
jgi:hypothetical protein